MIHPYHYKPRAKFYKTDDEPTPLDFYGLEKEVQHRDYFNIEAEYERTFNADGQTYAKYDGSIMPGFEIVSHPMSFNYHKTMANWAARNEWLDSKHVKAHNTDCCGVHIHVSRRGMDDNHQIRFAAFIDKNKTSMEKLARRPNNHFAQFQEVPRSGNMTENEYALNYLHISMHYDTDRRTRRSTPAIQRPRWYNSHNGRYRSVNFENKNTLEVRIFRSTLKTSTIIASIALVKAVREFTKGETLRSIIAGNWDKFCNMVATRTWGTEELVAYMRTKAVLNVTADTYTPTVDTPTVDTDTDTTTATTTARRRGVSPRGIGAFVNEVLRANPGWSNATIAQMARERFTSNTTPASVAWYRNHLRHAGV